MSHHHIQRFPRPYRFPRFGPPRIPEFVLGEQNPEPCPKIADFKARAAFYDIPWEEYREDADGCPNRYRKGEGWIHLRFPREATTNG